MDLAAAHLLDFSKPFDCTLLDQILMIAMDGSNPNRQGANEFLVRIKEHPDMWKRVYAILEQSSQLSTIIFGLQVLQEAIETRWKVILLEQREGIRNYIVSKIIAMSTSFESMNSNHSILNKLNLVLVQILKQDWPHNWPNFISDLVNSSKTSESLCENNMNILKLLSEEVFDFSKDSMTSSKAKHLKESLNEEFAKIFQLCEFILEYSQKKSLITNTLITLQRFLSWIPLGYIFETGLFNALITKFFPVAAYRVASVDCLTEIASLGIADIPDNYKPAIHLLLAIFVQQLQVILPIDVNLKQAYEESSETDQLFIQRLALFLGTFLRSFLSAFEVSVPSQDGKLIPNVVSLGPHEELILVALDYMILVSTVNDDEVFKTCLEFWHPFTKDLYNRTVQWKSNHNIIGIGSSGLNFGSRGYGLGNSMFGDGDDMLSSPCASYDKILHKLRYVMIEHMAKPEEVIIVEDENGEIVREMTQDTEVIAQYNTMHEALVFLTHLNNDDIQMIMLEKLVHQVTPDKFTWNGLNTLCWAIGSISGAMPEVDEKRFLVGVIKDLLRLCEDVRGKDNKAVVASNIMYIVGQYPRFLRAHWKFLKTVVNKLFEFMHEYHPGVQDMACDTFLKIASKCKRKFMTIQVDEECPFIVTLVNEIDRHTKDLQPHQILSFYESVSTMLSDLGGADPSVTVVRSDVLLRLMESLNATWRAHLNDAAVNVDSLLQLDTARDISRIYKISIRVCTAVGPLFIHQLSNVFLDALQIYHFYSEQIIAGVAKEGIAATRWTLYKALRHTKTDFLCLMIAFFKTILDARETNALIHASAADGNVPLQTSYGLFVPGLLNEVLNDYKLSPSAARDAHVLTLFATIVKVYKDLPETSQEVPRIMDAIFQATLELITTNMSDHPEHRSAFFLFLRNANEYCFYGLFSIPTSHQKLIVDSIVWAIKHTERSITETGLEILLELIQKVSNPSNKSFADTFYQSFYMILMHEILAIMTDRLHKSGFKLQVTILMHLFYVVQIGNLQSTLIPPEEVAAFAAHGNITVANIEFVRLSITKLLSDAFPNLSKQHIAAFVDGCFDIKKDLEIFKQHVRDFLICIKEFESEDNSDLFLEEREATLDAQRQSQWQYQASIPGLLKPEDDGISSYSREDLNSDHLAL